MEGCFHLFAYSGNVCTDADSHRKRFTEFIPTHGKPGKIRIKMKKISEKNPSWHTEDVDFFKRKEYDKKS